jgi:hypothetical protein
MEFTYSDKEIAAAHGDRERENKEQEWKNQGERGCFRTIKEMRKSEMK